MIPSGVARRLDRKGRRRPLGFERRGALHSVFGYDSHGRLAADGVAVEDALRSTGAGTPAYVYAAAAVESRFAAVEDAFTGELGRRGAGASRLPSELLVAVALKANGQPALLAPLARTGAGAEVVSATERLVAAGAGFPPDRVVVSGVGKTAADLDAALGLGVRFISVEAAGELDLLDARARRLGVRAAVVLRLNPELAPDTHAKLATGAVATKFGIPAGEMERIVSGRSAWPSVDLVGVHSHLGSQIQGLAGFRANAARVGAAFRRMVAAGAPARVADVGGGLGIPQREGESGLRFEDYARAVVAGLEEGAGSLPPEIVLEPGRSIFGPTGVFLTRVLHRKRSGGREFVIVDSGMNDFLRPAMYDAHHRVLPVNRSDRTAREFDVVGGVCETGDFFARGRMLPPPRTGDLLALLDAGAYGFSLASNINLRPRPAEVVLRDGRAVLARRAETAEELAARELGRPVEVRERVPA